MQEKKQKILLICLEVICLATLLPKFFKGTFLVLLEPIERSGLNDIPTWMAFVFILVFNAIWIMLMKLCPRDKIHVKIVLTLLVLTFSAAVLFSFIYLQGAW